MLVGDCCGKALGTQPEFAPEARTYLERATSDLLTTPIFWSSRVKIGLPTVTRRIGSGAFPNDMLDTSP